MKRLGIRPRGLHKKTHDATTITAAGASRALHLCGPLPGCVWRPNRLVVASPDGGTAHAAFVIVYIGLADALPAFNLYGVYAPPLGGGASNSVPYTLEFVEDIKVQYSETVSVRIGGATVGDVIGATLWYDEYANNFNDVSPLL